MSIVYYILFALYVGMVLFFLYKKQPYKKLNILKKAMLFVFSLVFLGAICIAILAYLWHTKPSYREIQHIAFIESWNCVILDSEKAAISTATVKILNDSTVHKVQSNGCINLYRFRGERIIFEAENYVADTLLLENKQIDTLYLKSIKNGK